MSFRLIALIACGLTLAGVGTGWSQDKSKLPIPPNQNQKPSVGILEQLGGGGGPGGAELKLSAQYQIAKGARTGRLSVRAELLPEWHIYATTQKAGGPMLSQILVATSPDFRLTRPFTPDQPPHSVKDDAFAVLSDMHEGQVIWTAPFELAAGVNPQNLKFDVRFSGQVCNLDVGCIPILKRPVEVNYEGEFDPPAVGQYQPKFLHAKLSGQISPRTILPGGVVKLTISAEPQKDFHVYAYAERDPVKVSKPTLIALKNNLGWKAGKVIASEKPIEHESGIPEEPIQTYHEKKVTWTVDLQVPPDAAPGGYELQGLIGLQTCFAKGCDPPTGAEFRVVVEVAKLNPDQGPEPLSFAAGTYAAASKLTKGDAAPTTQPKTQAALPPPTGPKSTAVLKLDELQPIGAGDTSRSMFILLPTAFLAGFLLNFMPCVLPVIGLKIVSFVNQSGEHRSRIFMLNFWYALGVLSVFVVLASLAVFAGFSWGDQFRSSTFNVVLACVVFAFALSFLGVWEIPLPGFVGSSGATSAAEKEGASGAFFKGALSTVLATPCGGPLLAPALTWAVAQPPLTAYVGFLSVGLGMAFPYLLVGVFPRLIAFLPKPGVWMETFKQIMGFVLMGTVVFILTFIPAALVVPTVAMMIGLWAALWWVGRVPVWDDLNKRIRAWAAGAAFAAVIGLVSFRWLAGEPGLELAWQPYSHQLLAEMVAAKRTVFVDFTAEWCPTCKTNERFALNVAATKAYVEENQIVTLKADMTNEAPDADELKAKLGGGSIPFYAVFPAATPTRPIVFDGLITKRGVLNTLKKAIALEPAAPANAVAEVKHNTTR
jgi:suppressor for copper-sensitivity B